jgi:hypothetical protein
VGSARCHCSIRRCGTARSSDVTPPD